MMMRLVAAAALAAHVSVPGVVAARRVQPQGKGGSWDDWILREDPKVSEPAAAARRVEQLPEFQRAGSVRIDGGAAQSQMRLAALRAGKVVLVPRPGRRTSVLSALDPAKIDPSRYEEAATDAGVAEFGEPVGIDEKISVDLIIVESLAVSPKTGARCGRDGRLANLEYGMLRQTEAVQEGTPVVTAVRKLQLVKADDEVLASCEDDVPADIICIPQATIRVRKSFDKPAGIQRERLSTHSDSMQVLRKVRARSRAGDEPTAAGDRATWKAGVYEHVEKLLRYEHGRPGWDAAVAAAMVEQLPEFQSAAWIRVGRGIAQHHIRLAALRAGKKVLVPQPELRTPHMLLLDPARIVPAQYAYAVTEGGMKRLGHPIVVGGKTKIDLFVIGAVAVSPATGARLGPQGGLEDLEYGLLRQLGAVDDDTLLVAAVRDLQLVGEIPADPALCDDVPVDVVCTPTRTIRLDDAALEKPAGTTWDKLEPQEELHKIARKVRGKSAVRAGLDQGSDLSPEDLFPEDYEDYEEGEDEEEEDEEEQTTPALPLLYDSFVAPSLES